jgi:amino acid transporter
MIGVFPVIFVGWKLIKRTKWLTPEYVCLRAAEVDEIDEYTKNYIAWTPDEMAWICR